jgi:hypothetical protein
MYTEVGNGFYGAKEKHYNGTIGMAGYTVDYTAPGVGFALAQTQQKGRQIAISTCHRSCSSSA